MNEINSVRKSTWQIKLENLVAIKVTGADREVFLQGQTTNDIKALNSENAILTCRLNQNGRIQYFFHIAKSVESFYLFINQEIADEMFLDLNKFIIMDDVELTRIDKEIYFWGNSILNKSAKCLDEFFKTTINSVEGLLTFEKIEGVAILKPHYFDFLNTLSGYPVWNEVKFKNKLINETRLNELAISYKKGCFLGQETVAKIENNRGAAFYPMLIISNEPIEFTTPLDLTFLENKIGELEAVSKINDQYILHTKLARDFRVEGKQIEFEVGPNKLKGKVTHYPFFKEDSWEKLAHALYEEAINTFNNEQNSEQALKLLEKSLAFKLLPDSLEIKGVILGRLERFSEAIESMNELTLIDPTSVMAHTNKSLFLMRMGKIEEAEEEKSLATVKSFEKFGEEARLKKRLQEEKNQKQEELLRREKMFIQVLEIDNEDSVANFGLGDIAFSRNEFEKAKTCFEKSLLSNKNYSVAYLMLGKTLLKLNELDNAQKIISEGIHIASKRGDMMPANEMQSLLNSLSQAT